MLCLVALATLTASPVPITPVSPGLRERFTLSPHYTKSTVVNGFPIVGSSKVADAALREARGIASSMLVNHPEYLETMAAAHVRLAVMAPSELTTDLPEHSDLTPKDYWDKRARGLGATETRPAISCAEENLIEEPGDPYAAESICVHEFAHAIHEMALRQLIPKFDSMLFHAFTMAKAKGTWANTYAMTNEREYWAEAVQSWFDTNRHDDAEHGTIDTREEVQRADPEMAALIVRALGKVAWRYRKPSLRSADELAELGPFPEPLPTFAWPSHLRPPARTQRPGRTATDAIELQPMSQVPKASPQHSDEAVDLTIENVGSQPVEFDWLDFKESLRHYATIEPGTSIQQPTYVGHVWVLSSGGRALGWFAASASAHRLVVPAPSASPKAPR